MNRNLVIALIALCSMLSQIGYADAQTPAPSPTKPRCITGVLGLFRAPEVCGETLLDIESGPGMAQISAIAFGPDHALYFARPATSEIMRLAPDGKGFFQPPQTFIANLPEPPNGLTYEATTDSWFVAMDTRVLRLTRDGKAPQTIVNGLPGGAGGWLGNIHVGPDRRLYVAKASHCDDCCEACDEANPRRGILLSVALDGSDLRIVARGLRDSYDFDWGPDGTLYIVDNERPTMPAELNAITPTMTQPGGVDFGSPRCDPAGQPVADVPGSTVEGCAKTIRPIYTFAAGSHPTGVLFYDGSDLTKYRGLLVGLSGSWNTATITGYELWQIPIEPGKTGADAATPTRILPFISRTSADAALNSWSFYPYHITSLAASREGWIYVAMAEGKIYRFRS